MHKFAIGQPAPRIEDTRFIKGDGCYLDDLSFDDLAHAAFYRSPVGHGRIISLDVSEASKMPGVIAVLTGDDVKKAGLGPLPTLEQVAGVDDNGIKVPERYALSSDIVHYVGEPVAMVIAATRQQADAGVAMIDADFDILPVCADTGSALDDDAALVWPQFGTNRCYHFHKGDVAATDAALENSAHVARVQLINNRLAPNAVEPRGVVGVFDPANDTYVLHVSGQAVHAQRAQMADAIFKVPHDNIQVIAPDVGGGFGGKNFVYPENVMVMLAARLIGQPVKWVASRSENFMAEIHARDHVTTVSLGLDKNHKFTALKVDTLANMGAYLSSFAAIIPTSASWVALGGVYEIAAASMTVDAVFTNMVPVDAYRGAGRPEAAYLLERVIDAAAYDLELEPVELRRLNLITTMPYKSAMGMVIDCGGFDENLKMAEQACDRAGFAKRKAAALKNGKWRGLGFASYLELVLGLPSDGAQLSLEDDGSVRLIVGGQSTGQGHHTAYAQLIHNKLHIAPDAIELVQGNTELVKTGGGHGGSRSLMVVGSAVVDSANQLYELAKTTAASMLESDAAELEFNDGLFHGPNSNRRLSLLDIHQYLRTTGSGLAAKGRFKRELPAYPNGVHVAEVEVDPETGAIELIGYHVVDDFGRVINPLIAAGQVVGGAVQGIGQALLEEVVYDEDGQLLSGSFLDYAMPRASDLPSINVAFNQNAPTSSNPLGVKGAGEAGATGAPPAVVNGVLDAVKHLGLRHLDMPLTPYKMWQAISQADGYDS